MIGKLKGIIDQVNTNDVLLDVGGVCYIVYASAHTLRSLPGRGEAAMLLIETHVREDHIHLYGFANEDEKEAFHLLNKVNGIGTKMALSILSVLTPAQLAASIAAQDKAPFKSISGVGPKIALRLLTELKDKFSFNGSSLAAMPVSGSGKTARNDIEDAVFALVSLGYNKTDAYQTISRIAADNDDLPIDQLIREGLKMLGGSR